jgi:glycosyltransferase involved in cell wall biosynthesis
VIIAWFVAPEANASTITDFVTGFAEGVDRINLVLRRGHPREPRLDRIENLRVIPDGVFDPSQLNQSDYCILLKEGLVYPAGFVRRMIAAYDDVAVNRKVVGVEGLVYSDFFDGLPKSQVHYRCDELLKRHSLVNQLGFEGIVFRGGDVDDFPSTDLLTSHAPLNFAIECFRRNVPQICIARGPHWVKRQRAALERSDLRLREDDVRDAQEIAGFGRLPARHLDGAGCVPTHAIQEPGRLIANEEFRNAAPSIESLTRMHQIAPHWFVDFLGSPHEFAVSVSQSGDARGLRIAVARAARALRLLTPVDPAAIASRSLAAEITLRGSGSDEMHPLIDGVYLVAMNAAGKPEVISRILGSIANGASTKTCSAEIKTPQINSQLDTFFCIQLSSECRSVDLHSASLVEAPLESKVSAAPRTVPPLRKSASYSARVSRAPDTGPRMALLNPNSAITDRHAGKPRMAAICCSLGQNALGRAYTLGEVAFRDFDVELLGALIPQRGGDLWAPMRDVALPIRGFVSADVRSYLSALRALSNAENFDVVYVSKPRFTSLLLGMVLSARNKCPLVLDIDDLELAFLRNRTPLTFDQLREELQSDAVEIDNPTGEVWTRYCNSLIHEADAITVCNEVLRSRFGGIVVRHARDERRFIPDERVRADVRRSLGIRDKEKVVFFLGTPRDHKGLARIAEAIVRRADPDLTMCVMGLEEPASWLATIAKQNPAFIRMFGTQPYVRLPKLIQCADAVCLLQDTSSEISAFQSPAKMGEALAIGLPVLVSRAEPFTELISAGLVIPVDTNAELQIALDGIRGGRFSLTADREKRMDYFRSELSIAANADRLREALELASANFPSTFPARLATLQKLARALQDRFGVDILGLRDDGNLRSRAEEAV